jgi:hypothetical protein
VLGFLERELHQVHLVGEAALVAHRRHERLNILGDRFLTGDELRAQPPGKVALEVRQGLPVGAVAREVDIGGILELRVATGEELHREAVPVESTRVERA